MCARTWREARKCVLDNVRMGLCRVVDASGSRGDGGVPSGFPLGISSPPALDIAWVESLGRCHGAPVCGCVATPKGIWK